MKRTTHLNITKEATEVMLEWMSEYIKSSLKKAVDVAKGSGAKTIGLDKGLSSSKISRYAKEHTDMNVSPKFIEGVKTSLSENIARITSVATVKAVDDKRKSISVSNIKGAITDIMKTEEPFTMEDEPIMPELIQEALYQEIGPVCADSVEVVADRMSAIFYQLTKQILNVAGERGRGKGTVKLEDAMDGMDWRVRDDG